MATTPPINITIDQEALKEQVEGVVTEVMKQAAVKLIMAAAALDPEWFKEQERWVATEAIRLYEAEHAESQKAEA